MLLEPVRSAEPPISAGNAGSRCSSVASDQFRVAFVAGAAAAAFFAAAIADATAGAAALAGCCKAVLVRASMAPQRFSQALRTAAPRVPHALQAASTWGGTSKGGYDQPSLSRAPLISPAPSGEPCVEALPCLVGAP